MAVNEEREDEPVPAVATRGFFGGFLGALQDRFLASTGRNTRSLPGQRQLVDSQPQPKAADLAPEGFRRNFTELYQSRMYKTGPSGERGENPFWRENTLKASAVNNAFLIKSSWTLAQLDAGIESKTRPSDERSRASLVALRTDVSEVRESLEELIAQHSDTKNVEGWGWTDEELAAQKKLVGDLDQINEHLTVEAQLRAIGFRAAASQPAAAPSPRSSAPARDADAPQGTAHPRAAAGVVKSAGGAVVMNPRHAVGLQGLEDHPDAGLESEGGSGR